MNLRGDPKWSFHFKNHIVGEVISQVPLPKNVGTLEVILNKLQRSLYIRPQELEVITIFLLQSPTTSPTFQEPKEPWNVRSFPQ